jgi:hypothetical protein
MGPSHEAGYFLLPLPFTTRSIRTAEVEQSRFPSVSVSKNYKDPDSAAGKIADESRLNWRDDATKCSVHSARAGELVELKVLDHRITTASGRFSDEATATRSSGLDG